MNNGNPMLDSQSLESPNTKDYAIKLAEEQYQQNGEIDILEIAHQLGLEVYSTDSMESHAEIFHTIDSNQKDKFEIFIKKLPYIERQRFSLAHEIAHFCLHKELIIANGVLDREGFYSLDKKTEREADKLAADILMPENSVNTFLTEEDLNTSLIIEAKDVKKIAKKFQVSQVAAAIRLRDMDYSVRFV